MKALIVTSIEPVTRTNDNGETKTYNRNTLVEATQNKQGVWTPKYPIRMAKTAEGYTRPAVAGIPGFNYYVGMVLEGELEFDAARGRWDVLLVEEDENETVDANLTNVAV